MGFDPTGRYLLVVTHSGRGVFSADSWERIARDKGLAYPENGMAMGIGPLDGVLIEVEERNEFKDEIKLVSPDGKWMLLGEPDGITVTKTKEQASTPNPSLLSGPDV